MTLAEFLHPVASASRTDQALAVLLYNKSVNGRNDMMATEVQAAMVQARIKGARTANVRQALARAGRYADQPRRGGPWTITETGERHLLETYAISINDSPARAPIAAANLSSLLRRVTDAATKEYIDEAITCLRAGSRRAAVVFLWSGAVATIRDIVWACGAKQIEASLQSHNPRAKFKKRADFDNVKDADLLQTAHDLGIYDKSQKGVLGHALDLRNSCGHPVRYKPGENRVESFIEDVVGIVWP